MRASSEPYSHSNRSSAGLGSLSSFARSVASAVPGRMSRRVYLALAGDLLIVFFALVIGLNLSESQRSLVGQVTGHWKAFAAWLVIMPVSLYYFDAYALPRMPNRIGMMMSALKGCIVGFFAFTSALYLLSADPISKQASLETCALAAVMLIPWRFAFSVFIAKYMPRRRVLIIGAGRAGSSIAEVLKETPSEYDIVGFLDDDPAKQGQTIADAVVLAPTIQAPEIARSRSADLCVVAISSSPGADVHRALQTIYRMGIPIVPMPDLYEFATGRVALNHWGDQWYVNIGYGQGDPILLALKRLFDILAALVGLAVTLPLWVVVGLAVKLTSPGPVFYKQNRVGLNGSIFTILKFRSMRQNAENEGEPVWAVKTDSRITPVGKFIRKTRLDELPQLINIVKGEMSLIGPRPERPEFVIRFEKEIPFYGMRLSVRPGLTGWAQVLHKYDESLDDVKRKLQYDLFYIKHWSPFLDLRILIRTIGIILTGKGAN